MTKRITSVLTQRVRYYSGRSDRETLGGQPELGSEQRRPDPVCAAERRASHPDAEARTTYVVKELNDKGLKTQQLALDTAMWDTAQAKDKMDAWLSGPNANKIEVVIANNDAMAMGAVEALKAHNKSSIPVFGVDALPEALALVKSGAMAGTVLNDANNRRKPPSIWRKRPTVKVRLMAPTGKSTIKSFAYLTWA